MHTYTIILPSLFALATATAAHLVPPQPPHPRILPRSTDSDSSTSDQCTFTLWHKQLSSLSSSATHRTNYIYLPSITDHANSLVIDVAAAKPAQAHNSYSRVSETQKFSIAGLRDGDALTISAYDDVLVFEMKQLRWEAESGGEREEEEEADEGRKAWCQGGEWVESGLANRERKVKCAFPCVKLDREDLGSDERVELK